VPAPIQRGSEALALSKHYNLKGKLPLQLDEVIVPVHIVGELGDANGRECAGTVGDPAVAAQRSNVGLENPFDSGIVALVTGILPVGNGTAWDAAIRKEDASATGDSFIAVDTSQTGFTRDLSDRSAAICSVVLRTAASGAGTPTAQSGPIQSVFATADGLSLFNPQTYRLPPGSRLWVAGNNDNQAVGAGFLWVELAVEPSEL
jgi:hypothetical protein